MTLQTKSRHLFYAEQAQECVDRVKALDASLDGAEPSEAQVAERKDLMAKAQDYLDKAKAAKDDDDLASQVKAFASEIGLAEVGPDGITGAIARGAKKSLGQQIIESTEYKAMISKYAKSGVIPDSVKGINSGTIELKSLLTGASDSSGGAFVVAEQTGIVEMLGRAPLTLRSLLSVRRTGSDTVEYVRQVSRVNAAAPVPEATTAARPTAPGAAGALVNAPGGGYKPEGGFAFERKTETVKTIAEWIPATKRALADVAQLESLINEELRGNLADAEETQILTGNGTGENLTGILSTPGIQAQGWNAVDGIFGGVRKGLTKVRVVGRVVPNGIAMNPVDVETVDLQKDGSERFYGQGPFGIGPRTLWGVPIVETEKVPAGTALLGDFKKAVLWDRESATVTMTDSHEDFFTRNLVAVLAEERVAFGVTRPTAFCTVDLAA